MSSRTGVFLDRDNTVIRDVPYLDDPDKIEFLPGAIEAIRTLNANSIPAILITNQSGIARGYFSEAVLALIHERLQLMLGLKGAHLDAIYYCPHYENGKVQKYSFKCGCRKPEPGLLLKAARDFSLDLKMSYMAGDKPDDIEVIHRVGGKGIRILTTQETLKDENVFSEYTTDSLTDAVRWILENMNVQG